MEQNEPIVVDDSDVEFIEEEIAVPVTLQSPKIGADHIMPSSNYLIAEERKNEGNNQYKAQNYRAALEMYSDAISLCPNNAAYYGNRAATHMMIADYKNALADARKSLQIDPIYSKGYIRVSKCCLVLGDLTGAEQAIKKFLELDSTNLALKQEMYNLNILRELDEKATWCYQKHDYRTCVYYVDQFLKIATACKKMCLLKGECLALLGRIAEANDIAITIMQHDSTNADAIFVRGLALYYGDNLDKGIIHFERALVLDPDHAKAKFFRQKARALRDKKEKGNELFKACKYREALVLYNEALDLDKMNKDTNSKLFYNRALVNTKLGSLREAIADCSAALEINDKYLKALKKRAKLYAELENFEECVKDYETALKLEKSVEIKQLLRDAKIQLKRSKRKDFYKILGVVKNATDDEIKKAYRKRALVHHPDRHASASAEEKKEQEIKFKEVGEAYAVLSDPVKRSRYDNGHDVLDEINGDAFDPSQLYRQFFFADGGYGGGSSFTFSFG